MMLLVVALSAFLSMALVRTPVSTAMVIIPSPSFPSSFWASQETAVVAIAQLPLGQLDRDDCIHDKPEDDPLPATTDPSAVTMQMARPVELSAIGQCHVSTSTQNDANAHFLSLQMGTQWIRIDWAEPVLPSRILMQFGFRVEGCYEFQIPDRFMADRWETVMVMPSKNTRVETLGLFNQLHEHDVDLPLLSKQPITALRVLIRDIPAVLDPVWASIRVDGYMSSVPGKPIVLEEPKLLAPCDTLNAIRVTASNVASPTDDDAPDYILDQPSLLPFQGYESCRRMILEFLDPQSPVMITRACLTWAHKNPQIQYEVQIPSTTQHGAWRTICKYPDEGNAAVEVVGSIGDTKTSRSIHTLYIPLTYQPIRKLRLLFHPLEESTTSSSGSSYSTETKKDVALWDVQLYGYCMTSPDSA